MPVGTIFRHRAAEGCDRFGRIVVGESDLQLAESKIARPPVGRSGYSIGITLTADEMANDFAKRIEEILEWYRLRRKLIKFGRLAREAGIPWQDDTLAVLTGTMTAIDRRRHKDGLLPYSLIVVASGSDDAPSGCIALLRELGLLSRDADEQTRVRELRIELFDEGNPLIGYLRKQGIV